MPYVVIQQHEFGRMYLCGWSKRWGATVSANRFIAIIYPTEDEARLACDRGGPLSTLHQWPADRLADFRARTGCDSNPRKG
jgi:hypothetical protein